MNKLAIIPKNKTGGIVTGTIMAIGSLIIACIVILVVVSTIKGANIIGNDAVYTFNITNESTGTLSGTGIYQLSAIGDAYYSGFNASRIINGSTKAGTNETLIEGTDYQIFSANNSVGNTTYTTGFRVTYTWTKTEIYSKNSVNNMTTNFTSGLDNVSSKLPTILLIVAVIFLFGALVLLVREAQNMGIGGGGGSL